MRIAAICATPRNRNTGMRCVDRALQLLLSQASFSAAVDYFCFDIPDYIVGGANEIPYQSIMDFPGHSHYDAIVIWGDFIITRGWLDGIIRHVSVSQKIPIDAVRSHIYDTIFFRQSPKRVSSAIVFGQCFLLDPVSVFQEEDYVSNLRFLLSNARLALLRDPISAWRASTLTGLPPSRFLGIDAALLLRVLANDCSSVSAGDRNNVGVFFGRTHGSYLFKSVMGHEVRRLGRSLQPVWLPWMPFKKMPKWISHSFGVGREIRANTVEDYLQAVCGCRFVVTDTYHLSLIAWSHGVPAVCIGRGAQRFEKTVHDKKKELFFMSNCLDEFYLFAEEGVKSFWSGSIRRALEAACDDWIPAQVERSIKRQAADNLSMLDEALKGVVG